MRDKAHMYMYKLQRTEGLSGEGVCEVLVRVKSGGVYVRCEAHKARE